MSSKLRRFYDKAYIWTEVSLLAMNAAKSGRKYARTVAARPDIDNIYKTRVKPYWQQYRVRTPGKYWYRLLCNQARPVSEKYIPDSMWFRHIVPHYNNLIFAKALQDKCLHSVLFPDVRRPVTVMKNIAGAFYDDALNLLTRQEALERCHGRGRVIVKPSVGSGQGHGIRFFDSDSLTDDEIAAIFSQYGQNFIIQEKLSQHPDLARLNPSSINTVRVVTFLFEDEVHVLAAILRVGGESSEVDNSSQGGYKCTIQLDGRLMEQGTTNRGGKWDYVDMYPNGIRFRDVTVPSYDKVLALVRSQASKMSHFRIIGWDIAIAPDGEPVLIEFNVIPAQGHGTNGPVFGELTDKVLADVFGTRGERRTS